MTKRLIGVLVLLPLSIILVLFALANRHFIEVKFDPLMTDPPLVPTIEVPLFLLIYAILFVGIILGGTASWFAQGEQRQQKRQWRREAKRMETERDEVKRASEENSVEHKALFDAT